MSSTRQARRAPRKAYVVEHRSLVNECLAFASHHGLRAGRPAAAVRLGGVRRGGRGGLLAADRSGSTVVVGHDKTDESVEGLLERCEREGVSVLNLPSGLLARVGEPDEGGRGEAA